MSKYEMNMSDEKTPRVKRLLPEGWRKHKIVACEEKTSKAGNKQFVITLQDEETEHEYDVYAVSVPGKRWFLKSILSACGVSASEDGVYAWDITDILNKEISCLLAHEDNDYINRDGVEIKEQQHRVESIKEIDEVKWDED